MPEQRNRRGEGLTLELDLGQVSSASFAPGPDGGTFSCSIGPITDETVAVLDRAAHRHTPVRLIFSGSPLLLDLQTFERKEPQCVRIVGRVVAKSAST